MTRAETGLRWLDRPTPELDRAKEQFREIVSDGRRAGAVMEGIRANFKKDAQIRAWLDVNLLIEETLTLIHGDLQQHRIQVRAEPQAELPQVMGDRIQLQQVLLNLITNAIEAMATAREGLRILVVKSETSKDGSVGSRSPIPEKASSHRKSIRYSSRCSRPNLTVWGWACRSAVPSLNPTMETCWCSKLTPGRGVSNGPARDQDASPTST